MKGQIFKQEVMQKILTAFEGTSFLYNDNKEIRINGTEEGSPVQIKVTLTSSKNIVSNGEDTLLPGETKSQDPIETVDTPAIEKTISQEEKQNIADMLNKLGL